jgi:glycerophosphoryl diester phosphodiesterase
LHELLDLAQAKGWHLNIEIKSPTPHQNALTLGRCVADVLQSHPSGQHHLVSSFDTDVLAGVQQQAPNLRRAYLLGEWRSDALDQIQSLGCCALVMAPPAWTAERLQAVRSVKAWALAYTVNDEAEAQRLWAMGLDALITDRVDLFSPEG